MCRTADKRHAQNGDYYEQSLRKPFRHEGGAHSNPRSRQRWKDDDPVQVAKRERRGCSNHSDDWVQCRDAAVQKYKGEKCVLTRNAILLLLLTPDKFQVWDLGGQTSIRPYWRCYYPNTDAIVFVVDSADVERMNVAKGELAAMLEEEELRDSILLVFANKQDQKGALNAQQISDALGLPEVRNRQWSIQETSALQGKGLFEGFDWLVSCIKGTEGE